MALSIYLAVFSLLIASAVEGTPARRGKKQNNGGRGGGGGGGHGGIVTCPGFPGYCSESYPGDTCLVVCARGRNNVPECQEDGTWTDIPRCIEHEPGVQEQVPGVCPGIPGYCSLDVPGGLCTFECPIGPAIRSSCTPDGTWEPYPTCEGDPRETQDGCNPCPGPLGGPRNRTAEAGGGGGRNGGGNRNNGGGGNRNKGGANRNNGGGGKRNNGGGNRNHGAAAGNRNNGGGNRNNGGAGKRNNGGGGAGGHRNNGGGQKKNNNRKNGNRPAPAQQPRSGGGFSARSGGGGGGGKNSLSCPGDVLQACIDVCPGFSARVFAACVSGCAKRCPGKK